MTDRFQPLTVIDVRPETRNAVTLTLQPDGPVAFTPGQYLTFRHRADGVELRRSYSICSAPGAPLQVAVKQVPGGVFSTWINTAVAPGMILDALPPAGRFHLPSATAPRHVLAFAAGSGITPILSILRESLTRDPLTRITLVYANRRVGSIMFREALEDLKNAYLGRFSVLHILGTDTQEIDLFAGRIDAEKLAALFRLWIDPVSVDDVLICGPEPLMQTIRTGLQAHHFAPDCIRYELFGAQTGRAPRAARAPADTGGTQLRLTLDGTTRALTMPRTGQSLLEAARAADLDAPFACKAGVCSTCRARVTDGAVEMLANHALEDDEVRAGFILTCQSYPLTDTLAVTYDDH